MVRGPEDGIALRVPDLKARLLARRASSENSYLDGLYGQTHRFGVIGPRAFARDKSFPGVRDVSVEALCKRVCVSRVVKGLNHVPLAVAHNNTIRANINGPSRVVFYSAQPSRGRINA